MGLVKRDASSQIDLLLKLADLLSKSQLARDLLEKAGKPLLAEGIKKIESELNQLETKVKSADPKTEVGKLALQGLEKLIELAEQELDKELKKIEGSNQVVASASQDDLLTKLVNLLTKSQLARELLEKAGKPLLAEGIKKIESELTKLETKVKNANPKNEIGKLALEGLEKLIELAEKELNKELKKIEESNPSLFEATLYADQNDLLSKLADLLTKSKLAQELLEKDGKPLLAEGIKKIEDLLHSLEEKVKSANPKSEVGKLALEGLEKLIETAEQELDKELKKIQDSNTSLYESTLYADQDDLLSKLADLLSKSNLARELLEKEGKPLLAEGIKKIEETLKDLEDKVKKANPTSEVGKLALEGLEKLIELAEQELDKELKKIGESNKLVSLFKRDLASQADLLLKLADLLSKSKLARDLLEKASRPLLAAAIKKIEDQLHSLEDKVKSADPKTEAGKLLLKGLEDLIEKAEKDLNAELEKINGQSTLVKRDVDLKDGLIKVAEQLKKDAEAVIAFLKSEGKSIEAAELQLLATVVSDIENRLETIDAKTEVGKLVLKSVEDILKKSENELQDFLKKLNAHP